MKKMGLTGITICSFLYANAQQDSTLRLQKMIDSIKESYIDEAALLYPRIRQFSISHQQNLTGKINSKMYKKEFFKSDLNSARTTINMNFPIIEKGKNILVVNLGVVHQFYDISNVSNYNSQYSVSEMDTYIPMINAGINYTRRDTLFGKSVSFTGSLNGLFNPSFSRRQFTFTGLISTPLIQKPNTRLIGGLVILADPASPIPAFLFVSYFHRFKSANLDLMVDLPYRIALRRSVLKRGSLTALTELAGNNSFFQFENSNTGTLPKDLTFSTLEIKSGLMFEYRITKKAVFSLTGGVNATATSKIFEKGEKPKNYFISNKNNLVPYVQVGISLLPFWKPFK